MTLVTHTVAIVEDDEVLRQSLKSLVDGGAGWRLTGTWPSAEEALPALVQAPPEVVLMDINLPGASGIECVSRLKQRCPQVQVLMVTIYDNSDQVFAALAAGASGYLLKRDIPGRLLECLHEVLDGGSPMSSRIARQVVCFFQERGQAKRETDDLTSREQQILERLAQGALYKEIAGELSIARETVNSHVRSIYGKLHVRSRTEAVIKFLKGRP
jgi:DNA-binding NarL/FixJ family response regulator